MGVHWAMEALDENPTISADLVDLRTLVPLDTETIYESVKKTNRVIILHEATMLLHEDEIPKSFSLIKLFLLFFFRRTSSHSSICLCAPTFQL